MIIVENATNVESVLYTDLGGNCPSVVQQKMFINSFLNCGCAIVCINKEKYEAYKVFHYNFNKFNECYISYTIFEFKYSRKKEFIVRIVVWDRVHNTEKIQSNEISDLSIESDVYYLSGEKAKKLKQQLKKLSEIFSRENKYVHNHNNYLEQEVYIDAGGVEKNFRWRSPSYNKCIQTTLESFVTWTNQEINELKQNISSVEFIFESCPMINEIRLFKNK